MRDLGAELVGRLMAGDVVELSGELGAGKTTLVRGYLEAAGWEGTVRSPTFNLLQVFEVSPPVVHADLYRVTGVAGIGLEDYLDTHILFVEWPDRAASLLGGMATWKIAIDFEGSGRSVTILPPAG